MSSWIRKAWELIQLYIFAEMPRAIKASRILRGRWEELSVRLDEDQYPGLPKEDSVIGVLAEDEKIRRKTLEEKARGNLFALTVCSSLVFAGFSFMAIQGVTYILWGHNILPVLFLFPMGYFAAAAISAVKALEVGEFYNTTTIEDQGLQPDILKTRQLNYVKLNDISTDIKANWTTVSFSCLRNAVISLLLFIGVIAFSLTTHNAIPSGQFASRQPSTVTAAAGGPTSAPGIPCCPCNSSESRGKCREKVGNRTHPKSGATKRRAAPSAEPVQ